MMPNFPYSPTLKATARLNIMAVIAAYCDHTGLKRTALSGLLTNDNTFIGRVDKGAGFTVSIYDRVMGSLSALWPDDLDWPEDVPRPEPAALKPEVEGEVHKRVAAAQDRRRKREEKEQANGRAA